MRRHVAGLAVLLTVCPALARAQERQDTTLSVVSGRVIDHEGGGSVPEATVSILPAGAGPSALVSRITGDDGLFRFERIAPGDYGVTVTALGYEPLSDTVYVTPNSEVRIAVYLSVSPLELEPIIAVSPRRPVFMDGFEQRRARDRTHTGFFTREEIEELNPRDISDLVRTVPGTYNTLDLLGDNVRVASEIGTPRACAPPLFVNGFYTPGVPYDFLYPPEDIEAVELYTLEHDTPSQFKGPQPVPPNCGGALVIWLREPDPWDESQGTSWKALAGWAGAIAAVTWLLH